MNLNETIALLDALRAAGVTRFKSLEHDIVLDKPQSPLQPNVNPMPTNTTTPARTPAETTADKEAREKIQNLINTLNMTPEQMAKYMFPEDV